MTIGTPVGPTACKGCRVGSLEDGMLTDVIIHCNGCADAAALREQLADVTESQTYWRKSSEDWSRQMAEARNQLRTAEALALANGEARERAEAEAAKLRVDMEEMVEAAARHAKLDAKLERLADGLTENGRAIDAAVVARAERAESEGDELRGRLGRAEDLLERASDLAEHHNSDFTESCAHVARTPAAEPGKLAHDWTSAPGIGWACEHCHSFRRVRGATELSRGFEYQPQNKRKWGPDEPPCASPGKGWRP